MSHIASKREGERLRARAGARDSCPAPSEPVISHAWAEAVRVGLLTADLLHPSYHQEP